MPKPNGNEWLEPVLAHHLGPSAAPDELWDRIRRPQRRERDVSPRPSLVLLLAAAAMLAALVWTVVPRRAPAPTHDALSHDAMVAEAIEALARGPEDLEYRSDTVTDIRAWVKHRTGLDIPLPLTTSQSVRMTGVCAMRNGAQAIEVAYRVRGQNAALLVSPVNHASPANHAGLVDGKHRFNKCETVGGARVSSWTMRGQLYTLAYSATGSARDECLLCHAITEQLPTLN